MAPNKYTLQEPYVCILTLFSSQIYTYDVDVLRNETFYGKVNSSLHVPDSIFNSISKNTTYNDLLFNAIGFGENGLFLIYDQVLLVFLFENAFWTTACYLCLWFLFFTCFNYHSCRNYVLLGLSSLSDLWHAVLSFLDVTTWISCDENNIVSKTMKMNLQYWWERTTQAFFWSALVVNLLLYMYVMDRLITSISKTLKWTVRKTIKTVWGSVAKVHTDDKSTHFT